MRIGTFGSFNTGSRRGAFQPFQELLQLFRERRLQLQQFSSHGVGKFKLCSVKKISSQSKDLRLGLAASSPGLRGLCGNLVGELTCSTIKRVSYDWMAN